MTASVPTNSGRSSTQIFLVRRYRRICSTSLTGRRGVGSGVTRFAVWCRPGSRAAVLRSVRLVDGRFRGWLGARSCGSTCRWPAPPSCTRATPSIAFRRIPRRFPGCRHRWRARESSNGRGQQARAVRRARQSESPELTSTRSASDSAPVRPAECPVTSRNALSTIEARRDRTNRSVANPRMAGGVGEAVAANHRG